MRQLKWLFILVLVHGCSSPEHRNSILAQSISQSLKCAVSAQFGDIEICLPEVDGMKECYALPIVKRLADEFEFQGNTVIAFYLNEDTYRRVDSLDYITYDDYFKIYGMNKLKGHKSDEAEIDTLAAMISRGYIRANWRGLKAKLEAQIDSVSFGRPILLEQYSPHDKVRSFLLILKYQMEGYEQVTIGTMNIMIIRDRLVWLAYYADYQDEETIRKARAKNDYIVLQVMDEN